MLAFDFELPSKKQKNKESKSKHELIPPQIFYKIKRGVKQERIEDLQELVVEDKFLQRTAIALSISYNKASLLRELLDIYNLVDPFLCCSNLINIPISSYPLLFKIMHESTVYIEINEKIKKNIGNFFLAHPLDKANFFSAMPNDKKTYYHNAFRLNYGVGQELRLRLPKSTPNMCFDHLIDEANKNNDLSMIFKLIFQDFLTSEQALAIGIINNNEVLVNSVLYEYPDTQIAKCFTLFNNVPAQSAPLMWKVMMRAPYPITLSSSLAASINNYVKHNAEPLCYLVEKNNAFKVGYAIQFNFHYEVMYNLCMLQGIMFTTPNLFKSVETAVKILHENLSMHKFQTTNLSSVACLKFEIDTKTNINVPNNIWKKIFDYVSEYTTSLTLKQFDSLMTSWQQRILADRGQKSLIASNSLKSA